MEILAILIIGAVAYAITQSQGTAAAATPQPVVSGVIQTDGASMYQSDGSLTGSSITSDPSTWPGSDKVWNICEAVALAEGYNQGEGAAPYDLNNPGDLSPGDEAGQATCGAAQQHGGSAIILFCTAEEGWTALYTKFNNIVTGKSSTYPSSLTWTQVAQKYAGNWQNWVVNVTNYLGVDPSTTPAQYVNS
jgi:hypothetical protein